MKRALLLTLSHLVTAAIGFAGGVYLLPILVAPPAPSASDLKAATGAAQYSAEFRRDLKGSDLLHWGEGRVSVSARAVAFSGRLAPGPDYKLYLSPEFVDTKEGFQRVKSQSLRAGDIRTFDNFIVPLPDSVDLSRFNTVVVWCETFSMFISAARYR